MKKVVVAIFLAIIISGSFFLNIYFVTDYKDEVFFHSLTRFWELGIGSILAIFLSDEHTRDKISLLSGYKYMNSNNN